MKMKNVFFIPLSLGIIILISPGLAVHAQGFSFPMEINKSIIYSNHGLSVLFHLVKGFGI